MQSLTWQDRRYLSLLSYGRRGVIHRLLACQAAGWLSLARIQPTLPASPPASLTAVVGGAALAVLALVALGPMLNLSQPALQAAGRAPGLLWPALAGLGFLAWTQRVGGKLLASLEIQFPEAHA